MYRILIADDERSIRSGLGKRLERMFPGIYEVVGTAADGEEALELSEKLLPDVIITDINMPKLNGLDYLDSIRGILPDARLLVISGYDKFEYAVSCMRLGVKEYFLKPVNMERMETVLKKIREELDELADTWETGQDESDVSECRRLIRTLREGQEETVFTGNVYCVAAVCSQTDWNMVVSLVRARLKKQAEVFELPVGRDFVMAIRFGTDDRDTNFLVLNRVLMMVHNYMRKENLGAVHFFIGRNSQNGADFRCSYLDAVESAQFEFPAYMAPVSSYEEIQEKKKRNCGFPPVSMLHPFLVAVRCVNRQEILRYETELLDWCRKQEGISADFVRDLYLSLTMRILSDRNEHDPTASQQRLADYREQLRLAGSPEEISDCFMDFMTEIMSQKREQDSKKQRIKDRVDDIMRENLGDSDFSLDDVASRLFLSPNYLRALFKKETGTTFTEYLTKMRMEQAKILLNGEQARVGEVAEQVGYKDARYFSSSFKKMYQISPAEYQNLEKR